ncbi:MAG TPA: fasciclin domain-containing protein [Salinimicrobium sp.]|nr:fasciclin domain-containing protein [Salinimicrobium sp.]
MKLNKTFLGFFAVIVLLTTSCRDNEAEIDEDDLVEDVNMQDDSTTVDSTVFTVVHENPELSTFSRGIDSANLERAFRGKSGNFTIFAPSDKAYENLDPKEREAFFDVKNMDMNGAQIYYLAVNEKISYDEFKKRIEEADGVYTMPSMQGEVITATLKGDSIVLADNLGNFATLKDSAMNASNGVIYTIDAVLKPMDANQNAAKSDSINNPAETQTQQ